MTFLIGICLVLFVVFVVPVHSDDTHTGRYLLDACSEAIREGNKDYLKSGYCIGYLASSIQEEQFRREAGIGKATSCMPKEATLEQVSRIVVKFLDDHPGQLPLPSTVLVWMALAEAWPCK